MMKKIKIGDVVCFNTRAGANNIYVASGDVTAIFNGGMYFNVHAYGPEGGFSEEILLVKRNDVLLQLDDNCVRCNNEGHHSVDLSHCFEGQE